MKKTFLKSYGWDICCILVILGILFSFGLGNRSFSAPDEGRYVEIPREMVATGDYLTPRLYGLKYFEKPVLFYWLQSFSIHLFGLEEWAMRLWPMIFGLLGCVFVYVAGRRLINRRVGLLSAGILATNFLYFGLSHLIVIDMPVAILLSGAMWSFIIGMYEPPGKKRRWAAWSAAIFLGLAVLAKGLMSVGILGSVVLLWLLGRENRKRIKPLYTLSALGLFLVVVVPWHLLVSLKNPEFFEFYFIGEHFQRYLTTVHQRYQPMWFFIPILFLGFLPWTAFLVGACREAFREVKNKTAQAPLFSFLLLWAGFVFVFFSLSSSKLITYIIPLFPPLAVMVAAFLDKGLVERRSFFSEMLFYTLFSWVVVIAYYFLQGFIPLEDRQNLGRHLDLAVLSFIAGGVLVPLFYKWKGARWAFCAMILATIAQFFVFIDGARFSTRISAKAAGIAIKTQMPPQTVVISYEGQYHDLPVYLERTVKVVDAPGELAFGHSIEPEKQVLLDIPQLIKFWESGQPVCVVSNHRRLQRLKAAYPAFQGQTLSEVPDCVVICNQGKLLS